MRYETEPQSNRAWFADQIKTLQAGIDEANRRATAAQGDLRDYQSAQQLVSGTLAPQPGVSVQHSHLVRRGGVATLTFRGVLGGGFTGPIVQVPAGFRPYVEADLLINGVRSAWTAQGYYIDISGFYVRPLTFTGASGDIVAFAASWAIGS